MNNYSLNNLYQDLYSQFDTDANEKNNYRDIQHSLKVLNYILSIAEEVKNEKDYDGIDVIKNKLNNDTSLFTYTFFVSSRSQFDYSWNYLRKQWNNYIVKLDIICKFILDMINKVNLFYEHRSELIADKYIFADLFILSFNNETNTPFMQIKWENMNNLIKIDKEYYISAIAQDTILMTYKFSYDKQDGISSFINYLQNWTINA